MGDKKIIILGGDGYSTKVFYNYLKNDFNIDLVVIEGREDSKKFIKRRIQRLGFFTVFGQLLFSLLISLPLGISSKKRIEEILRNNNLSLDPIPENKIKRVSSVNAKSCIHILKEREPDLILLSGTRIVSKKVLESVDCGFINVHAGITPKYRGVHGSYWAKVNKDEENNGVTIHFVDKGIDTGGIIKQSKINPGSKDNFQTYPYLQLAEGMKGLKNEVINDYFTGNAIVKTNNLESKLWYHPTIWKYLYHRIVNGVK